jgi:tetratricopeptide (TPR) repeat protein
LSDYHLSSAIHYYSDGTANIAVSASDLSDNSIIWSQTFQGWQHHVVANQKAGMIHEMTMALLQPFGVLASREAVKHAGTDSMNDPYRCVLESHDYLRSFDLKRSPPVRACLEAAVKRAPSWVSPYVQLARVNLRDYQFGIVQPRETAPLERAFAAATHAVQIKPTSASAYNVLQDVLVARGDFLGAQKAGETSIQLNPYDRFVAVDHALVLAMLGKTDEGYNLISQITGNIPTLPSRLRFVSALIDYLHGDMKAALAETGEMITPLYPPTEMIRALVAAKLGDHATAQSALDRLYAAYPAWRTNLRDSMRRFLPDPGMVDRIVTDFAAATADLTQ